MIKTQRNTQPELSDCKVHLLKANPCKIRRRMIDYLYVFCSEIERKKSDKMPKRGDFFHAKVFRRDDESNFVDKSQTFKF